MEHLLHPELLQSLPLVNNRAARALNQRAVETLADDPALDPKITVAIRAYNEASKLKLLLQDISKQVTGSQVEVLVIDNESTDHTRAMAREYGATIVTIPQGDFTYPKSMNLAMEAASHEVVFLTVAHALLTTDLTLHAGARHFRRGSNVGGVFSIFLPSYEASRTSKWVDAFMSFELSRRPRRIKRAGIGAMGATNAMVSKAVWRELGRFDERYETGGEDTALARKMLANGYTVIKEPALTIHHSHRLGPIATAREFIYYAKTVRGPRPMNREVLARRRARLNNDS